MPYPAQTVRLFQMVKHGVVKRKGLSAGKAASLLAEAGQTHNSGHPKSAAKAYSRKS